MHLPLTIKEIQAGYLNSSYFKDIYIYLVQNRLPNKKGSKEKSRNTCRKIYIVRFFVVQINNNSWQRNSTFGNS